MAVSYDNLKKRARLFVDEALNAVRSGFSDNNPALRPAELDQLEQRILMSASPVAVAAEAVAPADPPQADVPPATETAEGSGQHDTAATTDADATQSTVELVVIDPSADTSGQLVEDLESQSGRVFEVLILDPRSDGIAQITDALEGLRGVSAIHLVSHGDEGEILLGTSVLSERTIERYAPELVGWQSSLTADADLLIYGCDLAASEQGMQLTEGLNLLLGADVAASSDDTGNSARGGNWDFEVLVGSVDTTVAFTAELQAEWEGLLAAGDLADLDETRVNSTTAGTQVTSADSRGSREAVAISPNGEYVVVWSSDDNSGGDGDGTGVFMRRFNAFGVPMTAEIVVNTTTAGDQEHAAVAMDDNGRGIVVWMDGGNIVGRRFSETGSLIGGEFRINESAGVQQAPSVAMQGNGNFIVVWDGDGPGDSGGVFFRRFDASADALDAADILVNKDDQGRDEDASVAINDVGQFAIAWEAKGEIYVRHFDPTGSAIQDDLLVDTIVSESHAPSVAINAAGESVVVYRTDGAWLIGGGGVWGKRFHADGSTNGSFFQVSDASFTSDNTDPSLSMDDAGNFVVVYHGDDDGDGSRSSVKLRRYNADGSSVAASELVSESTTGDQRFASVAAVDMSNFVVVWSGEGTSAGHADQEGVFVRQFGTLAPRATLTAERDTYLDASRKNLNFGSQNLIISQAGGSVGNGRTLVQFDVSTVPNGATIDRAILRTTAVSGVGSPNVGVYEVTSAWEENTATWNESAIGVPWTTTGGDFGGAAVDTISADSSGIHEWDVSSLVQSWVNGSKPNHGVLLGSAEPGADEVVFESREAGVGPQLVLYYEVPVAPLNLPPSANAGSDTTIQSGDGISLNGTATDPEGDVLTYEWDLNYDSVTFEADISGQNPVVDSATLAAEGIGPGVYSVALRVDDGNGNLTIDTLSLTVSTSTIIVDTTSDVHDGDTSSIAALYSDKGADGRISLREAVLAANATGNNSGPDRIEFQITDSLASGAHTISLLSALPAIDEALVIDATTDDDFSGTPVVVLDGASAGTGVNGIHLVNGSDGSTVRGLSIISFDSSGIRLTNTSGNVLAGNFLGTDSTGVADYGNARHGIELDDSDGNTIGGVISADTNVILGNALDGLNLSGSDNNVIVGNYIGFTANGASAVGQDDDGVSLGGSSSGNRVGGSTAAEANVIVGNGNNGIEIRNTASANIVRGNYIGVSAVGTAFGNSTAGIRIHSNSADNIIGGESSGDANEIANNGAQGVSTSSNATRNLIVGNSIHSNGSLGIDVGHDGIVTFESTMPVLASAQNSGTDFRVSGDLSGLAGETYRVAVYSSPVSDPTGHGEGRRFLGAFDVEIPVAGLSTVSFNHTFSGVSVAAGEFVAATSSDAVGTTTEFSGNVTVNANQDPVASFTTVGTIKEGDSLTLDGTASSDPDGDSLTYEWDIDYDGVTFDSDFATPNRTLTWNELSAMGINDDGMWKIALRVTDGVSHSGVQTEDLVVTNTAPSYTLAGDTSVVAGETYTLRLDTSDPGDDDVISWTVNWGDGSVMTYNGTQSTVTHTYGNSGFTNNISVSVRDEDGSYTDSRIVVNSVKNDRLYFSDGGTQSTISIGREPTDVVLGPDGLLYVSNYLSDDIKRIDPATGDLVDQFVVGREGGLNGPARMAFGPDGSLFVTSLLSGEVLRFGNDGRFLGEFLTGLSQPDGITFDSDGNLFVSERATGDITKYDGRTGTRIGTGPFATFGQVTYIDLNIGPNGNLWASSTQSNVIRQFDASGNFVADFGGGPLTDVSSAAGFTWGPAGRLYVADFVSDQIAKYEPDGTFIEKFGAGLNTPVNVTFTSGLQVQVTEAPSGSDDVYSFREGESVSGTTVGNWFNSNWPYRQEITFDNVGHAEEVSNARVLVRLHSSAADAIVVDYSLFRDGGQDVRFVDQDGTLLDFEIEVWDETGYSDIWVEVPTIDAHSSTDSVFLYYGNQSASDLQDREAVWESDYAVVLHLNAESTDSTSNSNGGENINVMTMDGPSGHAISFDGATSFIRIPSDSTIDDTFAAGGTISAWIHPESWGENGHGRILDKASSTFAGGTNGDGWAFQVGGSGGDGHLIFEHGFSASHGVWRTEAGSIDLNSWQHVAVVFDSSAAGNSPAIFINGNEVHVDRARTPSGTSRSDAGEDLVVGNHSTTAQRTFDGGIDEVRISRRELSEREIAIEYESVIGVFISAAAGGVESAGDGVLSNDSDADGDVLTVALATSPVHSSSFHLNPDGSFHYTHDGSETVSDFFQYTISDGTSVSSPVTVNLIVAPTNDPPSISTILNQTIAEDSTGNSVAFTVADADDAAGSLVVSATSSDPSLIANSGILIGGSGTNRTLQITPVANASGGPAVITVTVTDGVASTTTTFEVTVSSLNDPPSIAAIGDVVTLEDTASAPISVTISDTDSSPTAFNVSVDSSDQSILANSSISISGSGANRQLVLTPTANMSGETNVTVTVSDGISSSHESFVFTVDPVDDSPQIAAIGDVSTTEDTPVSVNVSVSDVDTSVTSLVVTAVSSNQSVLSDSGISISGSGASRQLTLDPTANVSGTSVVTVTVSDGHQSTQTTLTIAVDPFNDSPMLGSLSDVTVTEGATVPVIGLSLSDIDDLTSSLVVSAVSADQSVLNNSQISVSGTGASRGLVISPGSNAFGSTTVTVMVSDGVSSTQESFVLTITSVNDAPSISSMADVAINEDESSGLIRFVVRDVDFPNANLVVTGVSSDQNVIADGSIQFGGIGKNRTLEFVPNSNASGGPVEITVSVTDGDLISSSSFRVVVSAVNDAPERVGSSRLSYRVDDSLEFSSTVGALLDGFADAEGDSMKVILTEGPSHGELHLQPDGTFGYVVEVGYSGVDQFRYVVTDGTDNSREVTVNMRVPRIAILASPPIVEAEAEETVEEEVDEQESDMENESDAAESQDIETAGREEIVDERVEESESDDAEGIPYVHNETEDDSNAALFYAAKDASAKEAPESQTDSSASENSDLDRVYSSKLSADLRIRDTLKSDPLSPQQHAATFTTTSYQAIAELRDAEQQLQSFRDQLGTDIDMKSITANTVVVTGTAFVVGTVVTAIRTGVLALGFLTQLPVWTMFDPLMVMDGVNGDEGDSLEEIVDQNARKSELKSEAETR